MKPPLCGNQKTYPEMNGMNKQAEKEEWEDETDLEEHLNCDARILVPRHSWGSSSVTGRRMTGGIICRLELMKRIRTMTGRKNG